MINIAQQKLSRFKKGSDTSAKSEFSQNYDFEQN